MPALNLITGGREMSVEKILEDRQKTHGDFTAHAGCTQELKNVIAYWLEESGNATLLTNSMNEALDMICHKIGRIVAGNPSHKDHWDDIAGYATLISRQLSSPGAQASEPGAAKE